MNRGRTTISGSILSKCALSVISTGTAYILVPNAFHYASTGFDKSLVIAVAALWILALTRMWAIVVGLTAAAIAEIRVSNRALEVAMIVPDLDESVAPAV